MKGNANRKVTPEQREQILQLYLRDRKEARQVCADLGLSPSYANKLASERGQIVPVKIGRKLTDAEKARERRKWAKLDDSDDPRWAIAIARGPVVAGFAPSSHTEAGA